MLQESESDFQTEIRKLNVGQLNSIRVLAQTEYVKFMGIIKQKRDNNKMLSTNLDVFLDELIQLVITSERLRTRIEVIGWLIEDRTLHFNDDGSIVEKPKLDI